MAIRVVIDLEPDGDYESAIKALTEKGFSELKDYAQTLEIVTLEGKLPGRNDRMKPAYVSLHEHDMDPSECSTCNMLFRYHPIDVVRAAPQVIQPVD